MQALARLSQVMKALTPRHVDVVVCVAKKLKENPELQGEKMAMRRSWRRRRRERGSGGAAVGLCLLSPMLLCWNELYYIVIDDRTVFILRMRFT